MKQRTQNEKRKSNFELLRICAMLMIIAHHLCVHGIMNLNSDNPYEVWLQGCMSNKMFSSLLDVGGGLGVSIFFLLTGYFMINNDKIRLIRVMCEVHFYGLINVILFVIAFLFGYDFKYFIDAQHIVSNLLKSILLPVGGGMWWFATVYVILMVIHPIINRLIRSLSQKGFLITIVLVWFFLYTANSALNGEFTMLYVGVFFYMLGGYVKKYSIIEKYVKRKEILLSCAIVLLVTYMMMVCFVNNNYMMGKEMIKIRIIVKILSVVSSKIIVPLSAVVIFVLFGLIRIKHDIIVNGVASTTFGIYLLHDSVMGREIFWHGLISIKKIYESPFFPIYSIGYIILIFAMCAVFDVFRLLVIEPKMMAGADFVRTSKIHASLFENRDN